MAETIGWIRSWTVLHRGAAIRLGVALGIALGVGACSQSGPPEANQRPGADQDAHGCKGSAGYRWSPLLGVCVRIWEQGVRLNPQDSSLDQTMAAYVLFDSVQSAAELHLPGVEAPIIMQRSGAEGAHRWEADSLALYPWKGYALRVHERVIYHGE